MDDNNKDPTHQSKLLASSLKGAVERARFISYVFAVVFTAYGFTSTEFIRRFQPEVSYFQNLWPRILLNTLPFFFLGLILQKSKLSDVVKLHLWISGFSLIVHSAAWIYVWPIALAGKPEILAYVNAANIYLFTLIFVGVAPPNRYLFSFTSILAVIFVVPLFTVAYFGKDLVIFKLIINDTGASLASAIILSATIHRLHIKLASLELERASSVSKFIGPVVYKALYENRKDLLETRKNSGFLLNMDIRSYTRLFQESDHHAMSAFMEQYFSMVSKTVGNYGGVIHRTVGDGHLISFGLMDDPIDLTDIPDLKAEAEAAEFRNKKSILNNAISCVQDIILNGTKLASSFTLATPFKLGAALDFGEAEIKIVGDQKHHKELDFFGSVLIRAARLEAHTKIIANQFSENSSLLIVSAEAAYFFSDALRQGFVQLETVQSKIRDFPEIQKIYAKEFKRQQSNFSNLSIAS